MANNLKTVTLLAFMSALVWWIGIALFGEGQGFYIGLLFAVGINFIAYFFSDKMALAAARATPVSEADLPQVYSIVDRLARQAGMPKPRVYLIQSPQPNAFATGRNPKKAVVAVTSGILDMLTYDELEGVLAHELAHVENRDILISSIAAMLAAALSIFARMAFFGGGRRRSQDPVTAIFGLLSVFLAPLAAMILRSAISRTREFEADASGAALTGRPLNLASALAKIGGATRQIPMNVNPAVSQLFIDDPLKALSGRQTLNRMFSTHPPVEERIRRLQDQASGVR
ncbi:MAG: zinc metalloprotease HtpX [Acidimicrobiia bacterium]|nr:zinc metalloprotease HtpX [Acidimicrobiia bacterium]